MHDMKVRIWLPVGGIPEERVFTVKLKWQMWNHIIYCAWAWAHKDCIHMHKYTHVPSSVWLMAVTWICKIVAVMLSVMYAESKVYSETLVVNTIVLFQVTMGEICVQRSDMLKSRGLESHVLLWANSTPRFQLLCWFQQWTICVQRSVTLTGAGLSMDQIVKYIFNCG